MPLESCNGLLIMWVKGSASLAWQAQAELLHMDADHHDVSCMAGLPLLTEIKTKGPAQTDTALGPAYADSVKCHGLVQELYFP